MTRREAKSAQKYFQLAWEKGLDPTIAGDIPQDLGDKTFQARVYEYAIPNVLWIRTWFGETGVKEGGLDSQEPRAAADTEYLRLFHRVFFDEDNPTVRADNADYHDGVSNHESLAERNRLSNSCLR